MFRKTLAGLISAIVLLTSVAVSADSAVFPDVDENHPNKTAIEYLKTNAVIEGYPEGDYRPENTVNRAELLKILIEGSGYEASEPTINCFPDVPTGLWFSKYVCFAKDRGWVEGYPDGYFRPDLTVNKAEALKMMGEVQGWTFEDVSGSKFQDADYDSWYASYLQYAEVKGILPEIEEGNILDPAAGMTRARIAENIFRTVAVRQLKKPKFTPEVIPEVLSTEITSVIKPQILINELEYGYDDLSWVELYNDHHGTVNLENWSLTNGEAVKFVTFPSLNFPAHAYLVVYLGHGENDLDFSDGSGSYYLDRDTGVLDRTEDAVALFDSEIPSVDSLVDLVIYCDAEECSLEGDILYDIAVDAGHWFSGDFVSDFDLPEEGQLVIGRNMDSTDTNSASDWAYEGGINSDKETPGAKNYIKDSYDFDEINIEPFDFSEDEVDLSLAAGLLIAKEDCDPVETLKKAMKMLKDSCYDEDLLNNLIDGINPDNLTGEKIRSKFMHTRGKDVTKVDLGGNIEIRLGKSDKNRRGEAYPGDTPDGKVVIEINLNKVKCDAEAMKSVLFHELVHEQQFRKKGLGFWDEEGGKVPPVSKNPGNGSNHVDPRIMAGDCMEVEAHLQTALCLQKEQKMESFQEYEKTMEKLLKHSKKMAKKYWQNGPPEGGGPHRKGCFNYINQIKNNISPSGKTIRNPRWLEENKKIWDNYMKNWLERIRALRAIFYEKYFYPEEENPRKAARNEKKFEWFLEKGLFYPKEDIDRIMAEIHFEWLDLWEEDSDEDATPDQTENKLPVIYFYPAEPTCEVGEIVSISASESYDPDGEIDEFNWYIDGILYDSGPDIEYECSVLGDQAMELRVSDDQGAETTKEFSITVEPFSDLEPPENQPPVILLYPAQPTCASGDRLSLSAAYSYDSDGDIYAYEWFLEGILYDTGMEISYYCVDPGVYTMELVVTDDDDDLTTTEFSIEVEEAPEGNRPPVVYIYPEQPVCMVGDVISISALESYDPDGEIYEFNWYLENDILYDTGSIIDFECIDVGDQSMELRAIDDEGATTSYEFVIAVEE